jgi:hypothetical protein
MTVPLRAPEHPNSAGLAPWLIPIPLLAVSRYALVALVWGEVGVRGSEGIRCSGTQVLAYTRFVEAPELLACGEAPRGPALVGTLANDSVVEGKDVHGSPLHGLAGWIPSEQQRQVGVAHSQLDPLGCGQIL